MSEDFGRHLEGFCNTMKEHLEHPQKRDSTGKALRKQMDHILHLAHALSKGIYEDAKRLNSDLDRFLKDYDENQARRIFEDALRLKHDATAL